MQLSPVRKDDAQLEKCEREFRIAVEEVRKILLGSSAEELLRKPSPGKWSALECVVHLNIVNAAMLPGIRQAVESASAVSNGKRAYRLDLQGWLFAWTFEPRPFIKLKTSPAAQPVDCGSAQETLLLFERTQT